MTAARDRTLVGVGPDGMPDWVTAAVDAGGGRVVGYDEADALVWAHPRRPDDLRAVLAEHPHLRWVQLPFAGIDRHAALLDADRTWTSGKGVYSAPVAEMALALLLAGLRNLGPYARAGRWTGPVGRNLVGARLAVLGAGGITEHLLRLLEPFSVEVTVVRRDPRPVPGAARVVAQDGLREAIAGVDGLVLALALTEATRGIIGRDQLERVADHACVVNVARGGHVVTDDLVAAFAADAIGSAGLDVTDPEPLPDGHPLWAEPRCTITPHVGNTPEMAVPLLSARITDNVARWIRGEPLVGVVDVVHGY